MEYRFEKYSPSKILRGHLKLGGADPRGERIDVNSLYIERGGRPWIPVMGEYHFVRDARERWPGELAKMAAGGVRVVSVYIFWIYHEETEGIFDFTGDRDLRRFILDCAGQGLDVVIRIGPWCHGEVRNGGLPDWILQKPYKVRDNNPEYMEKARIWYERIFREVKGLFYKDGGPIIGVQIENELVDAPEHLAALKKLALETGFDVPLWTVTGWNSRFGARIPVDEFMPVFGGYADAPWAGTTGELPLSPHYAFSPNRNDAAVGMDIMRDADADGWRLPYERYPFATCELGGGIQPTHHRRPWISPMDVYAMSLVKLGSGNNLIGYYMYHGGANKIGKTTLQESKATGYPNDLPILNYDFQAPISQYGEIREQYGLLNLLHLFAEDFGALLAPMEYVPAECPVEETDDTRLRYAMRTDGAGGFVFVNHHQRHLKLRDVEHVELRPLGTELPAVDVRGDIAFILPFNLKMGGEILEWATAQLVCREGGKYYFAAIPGIEPRFKFQGREESGGGDSVVCLPWDEALRLRRVGGKLVFAGDALEPDAALTITDCSAPFVPPYLEELRLAGEREIRWKKLSVDTDRGFVTLPGDFDVAEVYADGALVADKFDDGAPWRVPAALLYGRACYLARTDVWDVAYREP